MIKARPSIAGPSVAKNTMAGIYAAGRGGTDGPWSKARLWSSAQSGRSPY